MGVAVGKKGRRVWRVGDRRSRGSAGLGEMGRGPIVGTRRVGCDSAPRRGRRGTRVRRGPGAARLSDGRRV